MTDYTAKNVILKDANGGYLIPYTEKLERDLSDITSAGSQAILNNVHTDGNVVQAWSSSIVPTANKTLVSYYVSSELKFYLNTTGVNTSTAPSSDTTNWMEVSLGGGGSSGADVNLSNLSATGENHFANPDMSNLSVTGKSTIASLCELNMSASQDVTASAYSTTGTGYKPSKAGVLWISGYSSQAGGAIWLAIYKNGTALFNQLPACENGNSAGVRFINEITVDVDCSYRVEGGQYTGVRFIPYKGA